MNILHHKSWHVRTKQNIERVRRDEEKAANEEKEKQRKIALAEQEARTEILRSRTRGRLGDVDRDKLPSTSSTSSTDIVPTQPPQTDNVNFFKDIEDGLQKQGINAEHQKEKKAETEKWEKKIGLLTYLGKSNIEEQNETPWYLSGKKRKREEDYEEDNNKIIDVKKARREEFLDPLITMKEYVDKKKKKKKHKDDRERKHKKHKKEKSKEKDKYKALPKPSTGKTIEQLRAERLKREQIEKHRAADLFSKTKGNNSEHEEEAVEDRSRKYNSQYNPELSRKHRKHRDYE